MIKQIQQKMFLFFSSRRRHTRSYGDWSSDVCSSDLVDRRVSRAFRHPPRLPPWPGGLSSSHHNRRGKDREGDGPHRARRKVFMNTGTAGRTVGRPEPAEIPSPWVGYVKRVPELDPVMACAAQIEETANLLRIARGDTTPLPGFDEN